jgi:hypothetical protein
VRASVLGFIFMGPRMSAGMGAKLYNTLKHYQKVLPCLWELQQPPCRLLGCRVMPFQPAIAHLEMSAALRDLAGEVHSAVAAQAAAVAAAVAELSAKLDRVLATRQA